MQRDTLRYVLRLLNRFIAGQHKLFYMGLLMLLAESVTSIYEAYPLAYLVDFFREERPDIFTALFGWQPLFLANWPHVPTVAILTVAIVVIAMLNSLGDSLAEIYLAKGGRLLGFNLRQALYVHLQKLSLAFHDQRRTGDVLTRLTGDVSEVENFVIGSLSDVVGGLLTLIGTLAVLIYYSWQVALVAAVIIPVMAFVSNYFSQRIKAATKKQRAREGDLANATQEMLASIRLSQTYNRGDQELKRFAEYNERAVEVALQAAGIQARFSWVVKVTEALATTGVIWLGTWLLFGASSVPLISVGTLIFLIAQVGNMFKPTRKIIKEWNTIAKLYASVERIGELLDRKPAVVDAPNAIPAPPFRGNIEFRQVNFAYQPEVSDATLKREPKPAVRQALQDVNFKIGTGQVMALVGHTGAGKSTIIQLLPRLYDPTGGSIRIDGADIRRFTLDSLRDQISVVLQETILFNGTVAENIAYGRTDATRDEIMQAAVQANAHGFIEKMPQGYDTMLGERGANLSGGQRQRLAIARAFVRNTPILILDEPTTGLDAESSELVYLALRMLMRGKTTIIISHDFKLVRQADQIVVLREGRIEQMGTHRELLKEEGTYANLYIKQFGQIKPEDEQVEGSYYDLLNSPAFQHKWPTVRIAFDAEAMQVHLQSALFGPGEPAYTIVHCKPGKASFLGAEGCLLRYDLQLKPANSEETQSALVLARVFPDATEATTYLEKRLMPLATKMAGRPELAPFANPVAFLDSLNMTVSVFPIDGELPMLIPVTNRQYMTEFFQENLPEVEQGRLDVTDCVIEPGHYGRQHRCVLRYTVQGNWAESNQPGEQIVYGKIAADDRCKLVGVVINALQWQMRNFKSSRPFRIPRIMGYRPNLKFIALESIPGTPCMPQLLRDRMEGKASRGPGALTLEAAVQDCARIAAGLHKADIKTNKPRRFDDELADLQAELAPVQEFSLALAMELEAGFRRIQASAQQSKAFPLCFSHGDYTYTQLLFDDTTCGLVDFDTACQAEPMLDLGQFLAYLRLETRKLQQRNPEAATVDIEELCELFVSTYIQAAGYQGAMAETLRARAAIYEIISLSRVTLHSWQKMKSSRLEMVTDLLQERLANLPSVTQVNNARKAAKATAAVVNNHQPELVKQ